MLGCAKGLYLAHGVSAQTAITAPQNCSHGSGCGAWPCMGHSLETEVLQLLRAAELELQSCPGLEIRTDGVVKGLEGAFVGGDGEEFKFSPKGACH